MLLNTCSKVSFFTVNCYLNVHSVNGNGNEIVEYTFLPSTGKVEDKYRADCHLFPNGFVECNPGGFIMPKKFQYVYKQFLEMEVRPDDTWVITFPKCGTTWTQEMVWLIGNSLDYEKAQSDINARFPFVELSAISDYMKDADLLSMIGDTLQTVTDMPSPRFIKSHLFGAFLPKQLLTVKPKIVYVARNPKDVAVSFFYHHVLLEDYKGKFADFLECFRQEKVMYCPYWENILSFWHRRNEPNILFIKYEDMKKDLGTVIRQVAEFLERSITDEQLNKLKHHLSFEEMKKNPFVNQDIIMSKLNPASVKEDGLKFIRKGQIGDWKNHLNQEQIKDFDEWVEEKLKGTGLSFVDT